MQIPEFGAFQKGMVRRHDGDHEAGFTVEKSEFFDIGAQKCCDHSQEYTDKKNLFPGFIFFICRDRGVFIYFFNVIADGGVCVVQNVGGQVNVFSVRDGHDFMQ